MGPFDMGQGNSVSTSNAQNSKAEQKAGISGNRIIFGSDGGLDFKTVGLIAVTGLAAVWLVSR
ncbi:hypothetical protein HF888_07790 [Bermanella marisrubri]|uniref:Uncharacterized protein n=1 Tax=Bermanella marisrubri TaxID=207949 RepID=Q1N4P8_9GAMM|nr:hypothetical protein [Bermanella marisrubri]EAT13380.1 hypothetical protein RED65_01430 [Oceanobacter sp. RED65] [Bermanella marisrubri]QIZ84134.1 hypothetical protein HF888_07790 [Bermanella marisrubri]